VSIRQSFGFPLNVYVGSDVGRVRSNNEDSFGHAWLEDGSLFVIVADGMGGHEAGEVASGLAVRVAEEVVSRDVEADPRERLYNGLVEANDAILDEGRASGTRGMGTTAICAVMMGSEVHIGQVGDSRLYHIRRGQPLWRTLDHTRVQMLLDQGEISEEEARNHPEAGMLTRALGHARMADGRALVPDVLEEPIVIDKDDAVVLCSDGLHDLLEDWEIGQIVAGSTPKDAANALIAMACDRGGHDNVTVAVIVAGDQAEAYDPDFAPEYEAFDAEAQSQAEVTYDELPAAEEPAPVIAGPVAALAAGQPMPPPAPTGVLTLPGGPPEPEKGGKGMFLGLAAMSILAALVLLAIIALAGAATAYFMMGAT
jgi:PPM family protein phosphatase